MDNLGVSFNHIENQVIHNASQTSQLYQRGLRYSLIEQQSQADQNMNSRDTNANTLSQNNGKPIWGVRMPPSQQVLEHVNAHSKEGADPRVQPSLIRFDPHDRPYSQQYYTSALSKSSSFFSPVMLPTSFSGQCGTSTFESNGHVLFTNESLCSSKGHPSTDCYQGAARSPLISANSTRFLVEGLRRVPGGTAPSPAQSPSITSFFDNRPSFPDESRLKRHGMLAQNNQILLNKECPSVPVENHVLPPSTCQNFYPEQRKACDTVPNAYLDNLVPFSNEGVLSCNPVVPEFKRPREVQLG